MAGSANNQELLKKVSSNMLSFFQHSPGTTSTTIAEVMKTFHLSLTSLQRF